MADVKDMQGYNNLVGDKQYAQSRYNSFLSDYEEYTYKIRRLRKAKETVAAKKTTFKTLKRNDKRVIEDGYKWKGSNYKNILKVKGQALIDENEKYYSDSIDYVLDAINDEITRLENKRREALGIMNGLLSTINNLSNEIENYFN